MMNITKGKLMADDWGDGLLEVVGEYWTSELDYYTVCISYCGELLSMDKGQFPDWLQLKHLLMDDVKPSRPTGPAFVPFDVGFDVPEGVE